MALIRSMITSIILVIYVIPFCLTVCQSGIYENGLSASDRQFIVDKHNELRTAVAQGKIPGQPKALNMKHMNYSLILEKKAQEVADTCVFEHVTIKGTPWGWVGQNIYIFMSTGYTKGPTWNDPIMSWFNEYKLFKFGSSSFSGVGHYTQLVWADTTNVGCGYTSFPKASTYKYQKLYVCNYGPGGNIVGETPYRT